MSSITVSSPAQADSRAINWKTFSLVGIGTVLAALIANLIVYYLGGTIVTYDPEFVVLANASGTIFFTVTSGIVAVLVYAGLVRFTNNPARIFKIVSAVVLIVSLIPDFTYIPTQPGATGGQAAILAVMHVVAAGVIVWMLTTLARPGSR